MRRFRFASLLLVMAWSTTGCAAPQEWKIWREHPAHFASATHMAFSVRNTEDTAPRATRRDLALSRAQAWWGTPVTVSEGQILER